MVRELNARDLLAIWASLSKAEKTGDTTDAYLRVVARGTFDSEGERIFPAEQEMGDLPARVVVPLAERILGLSEVELNFVEDPTAPPDP